MQKLNSAAVLNTEEKILNLLEEIQAGRRSPEEGVEQLRKLPFLDLGHSKLDLHRVLRSGFPEVVFGEGKDIESLLAIVRALIDNAGEVLVTRCTIAQQSVLKSEFPELLSNELARTLRFPAESERKIEGKIAIISGGTSDKAVAEECEESLLFFGLNPTQFSDMGVAGLPRLLQAVESLRSYDALVVVAGMEGALASVVTALIPLPVVAVPTSVGYGASFQGLSALLGMLVSCSPGLSVVNIDNGFGAAAVVARMCSHLRQSRMEER